MIFFSLFQDGGLVANFSGGRGTWGLIISKQAEQGGGRKLKLKQKRKKNLGKGEGGIVSV